MSAGAGGSGMVWSAGVVDFEIVESLRDSHAVYVVEIIIGVDRFTVRRRWSRFQQLREDLVKARPTVEVPELPSKLKGGLDVANLKERRQTLNLFMRDLQSKSELKYADQLIDFLQEDASVDATDLDSKDTAVGILLQVFPFVPKALGPQKSFVVSHEAAKKDEVVVWEFKTAKLDIGFSVSFDGREVIGYQRVKSHERNQQGSYTTPGPGRVDLKFDNTYSRFTGKTLEYRHDVQTPEAAEAAGKAEADARSRLRVKRELKEMLRPSTVVSHRVGAVDVATEARAERDRIKAELEAAKAVKNALQQTTVEMTERIADLEEELASFKDNKKLLLNQIEDMKRTAMEERALFESAASERRGWAIEKAEFEKKIEQMIQSVESAKRERERESIRADEMAKERDEAHSHEKQLRKSNDKLQRRIEKFTDSASVEELEKQLAAQKAAASDAQGVQKKLAKKVKQLLSQVSGLENELTLKEVNSRGASSELETLRTKCEDLEKLSATSQSELATAEKQKKRLAKELKKMHKQLQEATETASVAKASEAQAAAAAKDHAAYAARMKADAAAAHAAAERASTEAGAAKSQLAAALARAEAAEASAQAAAADALIAASTAPSVQAPTESVRAAPQTAAPGPQPSASASPSATSAVVSPPTPAVATTPSEMTAPADPAETAEGTPLEEAISNRPWDFRKSADGSTERRRSSLTNVAQLASVQSVVAQAHSNPVAAQQRTATIQPGDNSMGPAAASPTLSASPAPMVTTPGLRSPALTPAHTPTSAPTPGSGKYRRPYSRTALADETLHVELVGEGMPPGKKMVGEDPLVRRELPFAKHCFLRYDPMVRRVTEPVATASPSVGGTSLGNVVDQVWGFGLTGGSKPPNSAGSRSGMTPDAVKAPPKPTARYLVDRIQVWSQPTLHRPRHHNTENVDVLLPGLGGTIARKPLFTSEAPPPEPAPAGVAFSPGVGARSHSAAAAATPPRHPRKGRASGMGISSWLTAATSALTDLVDDSPSAAAPQLPRFNVRCSECGAGPLRRTHWRCSECPNFSLCCDCYDDGAHGFEHEAPDHSAGHASAMSPATLTPSAPTAAAHGSAGALNLGAPAASGAGAIAPGSLAVEDAGVDLMSFGATPMNTGSSAATDLAGLDFGSAATAPAAGVPAAQDDQTSNPATAEPSISEELPRESFVASDLDTNAPAESEPSSAGSPASELAPHDAVPPVRSSPPVAEGASGSGGGTTGDTEDHVVEADAIIAEVDGEGDGGERGDEHRDVAPRDDDFDEDAAPAYG